MKTAREYQTEIVQVHKSINLTTKFELVMLMSIGEYFTKKYMLRSLGDMMIACLGFAETHNAYISFEEAQVFAKFAGFTYEDNTLIAMVLQNISSLFILMEACPEGEYRPSLQRMFNNLCALAWKKGYHHPIVEVFLKRWTKVCNDCKTYEQSRNLREETNDRKTSR